MRGRDALYGVGLVWSLMLASNAVSAGALTVGIVVVALVSSSHKR